MTKRHIVAMGGGGFLMDGNECALDAYTLSLARKKRPRVCFVPTASGDSRDAIVKFYEAFPSDRAEASHLRLFGVPRTDIREFLLSQHVIYVGGGNTANMLAVWRVHGVDRFLHEAWRRGVVLTGVSAGMLCWFEGGVTDSFGRPLCAINDGLGFLKGSACPHYDGEADRRPTYHRLIREWLRAGVAADDGAAIHYVGTRIHACVRSRRGANCYRVSRRGGAVLEATLEIADLAREEGVRDQRLGESALLHLGARGVSGSKNAAG